VNSVARGWITVRADASPRSRVIASIGPNTRVQLGESRGAWRRIKAKGLSGWVQNRAFSATLGGSPGTGRLAAR
jgi:SH3-like domain-containing protein